MANLEDMVNKFIVIKRADIDYLTNKDKDNLCNILFDIEFNRRRDEKTDNNYLVINTDEPYADEIIEIMKRNGHWG